MPTLTRAIHDFHQEQGLPPVGSQTGLLDWFDLAGIPLPLPNPPKRQRLLVYHDAHHIVSGFGTDFVSEFLVGAWCVGAGRCPIQLGASYDGSGLLGGLLVAPIRTWRAFAWGHQCRDLYAIPADQLVATDVEELCRIAGTSVDPDQDAAPVGPFVVAVCRSVFDAMLAPFAVVEAYWAR